MNNYIEIEGVGYDTAAITFAIESCKRAAAFEALPMKYMPEQFRLDADGPARLSGEELQKLYSLRQWVELHWIIEKARERFADGTGQSRVPEGNCLYTDAKGNHCVVGAMLCQASLNSLAGVIAPVNGIFGRLDEADDWVHRHVNFLLELQHLHDKDAFWAGKRFIGQDLFERECEKALKIAFGEQSDA